MDKFFRTSITYRDPVDKQKKRISMNIFDAFKGVPDPKPATAPKCKCCGKTHSSETATLQIKKGKNQKGEVEGLNLSKAENNTLKQMVADHKSWESIRAEISKGSIADLKAHYEKIKPTEAQLQKEEEKKAKAEKHKAEGLKKKKEKEGDKGGEKTEGVNDGEQEGAKGNGGMRNKSPKKGAKISTVKTAGDGDDSSQLTEKNLKAWTTKYDQNKWDMAASKYFDMTGQHLAPEQVRKMMAK